MYVSDDNGKTWNGPKALSSGPLDDRDAGVCQAADGSLLVNYFTSTSAIFRNKKLNAQWKETAEKINLLTLKKEHGFWMRRSVDGGKSWSRKYRTPVYSPHGPVLMKDGTLFFPGQKQGSLAGEITATAEFCAAFSKDNGLTWQSLGVSAKGTDGQNGTNGTNGQNGANGNDGRGIAKMEIIDGCLYVTYTDSPTPVNLGKISSGAEGGVVTPPALNYTDGLAFYPVQDENGTGYTYGVAIGNAIYMRDIVIPTIYNGKAVTVILSGAFANADYSPNSTVSSVVIPEGIKKIGDSAFYNCDNIAKITLPSTIEEIGIDAFAGLGASTDAGSATIYINLTQAECEARGLALEESGCTVVYLG
jgi:hypothetical protein